MRWAYLLLTLISFQSLGQVLELYKDPNRFIYNYTPEKVERSNSRTLLWEEDFANGLMGNNGSGAWEVFGPDSLIWKHDFWGTSGEWSASTPSPNTTTVSNGFMLFDADSANFPLSPNYVNLNASLMSPRIDLTGKSSTVLSFEHWFRHCCSGPAFDLELDVSIDNGLTWTTYNLDSNISQSNSPPNPSLVQLNLTNLIANEDSVRLRFNWVNSSHYFWVIDDIRIEEAPPYDLKLENFVWETVDTTWGGHGVPYTFVAIGSNYNMMFSADAINNGNEPTDSYYKLSCYRNTILDTIIYTDTSLLMPGNTIRDTIFYEISNATGSYFFTLEIMHDSISIDVTPDNFDSTSINTYYTHGVYYNYQGYSTHKSNSISGGIYNGDDGNGISHSYVAGVTMEFSDTTEFSKIEVHIGNGTDAGCMIYGAIYEVDSAGNYTLVFQTIDHDIKSWEINSYIALYNLSASSFYFEPNKPYLICVGHYGGPDYFILSSTVDDVIQPKQNMLLDGTTIQWTELSYLPAIRLNDHPVSVVEFNSTPINLHPNPTSNQLHVSLESIPQTYQILDLNGKLIATDKANEQAFTIDVQDLPKGMYILQIQTEDGTGQEKFVVE